MENRRFNRKELSRYDGKDGAPAFVACRGVVYDVTGSFLWPNGTHQVLHAAGRDLTESLHEAPHDAVVLTQFPIVGFLEAD
jgi:predicted heme/steroid binding protein